MDGFRKISREMFRKLSQNTTEKLRQLLDSKGKAKYFLFLVFVWKYFYDPAISIIT